MENTKILSLLVTVTGLPLSNYGYQFAKLVPDYAVAFERSFFQVVACICMYLLLKVFDLSIRN